VIKSSGSLAMFAAIRRAAVVLKAEQQLRQLRHVDRNPPASSRVSSLAVDRPHQ
jgi:hypothetical protein